MSFHAKSCRSELIQILTATREFEQRIARTAVEMMVMWLISPFIESPERRKIYAGQPSILNQAIHVAVDRGKVDRWYDHSCHFQHFLHAQGAIMPGKYILNRLPLGCALHFKSFPS